MRARNFRAPLTWLWTAGVMLVITPAVLAPAEARTQDAAHEVSLRLADRAGYSLGPPGGEVRSLAVAATDPDRLYLGTSLGHLYRSGDRGERWESTLLQLGHEAVIDNLLVHPTDPDQVWAAYWRPAGTGGLVLTTDGGDSWRELDLNGTPSLRALAMAPGDPDLLYAGGIGGVWRSGDGGESWFNINGQGLSTEFIESLAVDPRDPDHIYAGTWRQVYRTRNGGTTWQRVYQGMALDRDVFSIAISPHDPDLVFAGTCNYLYCSTNAGGSWGERRTGLARDHNRIHTIVHDPVDPNTVYAGTRGALYRSTDGGTNWTIILPGIAVSALVIDPEGQLLVGTEERGVLRGPPDGPYEEINDGLLSARITAFDTLPGAPRVLFVARADGPLESSLHYSTDLGASWRRLGPPRTMAGVRAIRAQTKPLNRVLIATLQSWWSVVPGGEWNSLPSPPGATQSVEIAHDAGGIVLAATSEGLYRAASESLVATGGDARPFDAVDSAAWRPLWEGASVHALAVADDAFVAWTSDSVLSGRLGNNSVTARPAAFAAGILDVALDPGDPNIGYAISRRDVYRTDDGGRSWTPLALPWPAAELRGVAMDPTTPDQVLLLDYRGAIYRGHGGGAHWLVLDDDPGLHRAWDLQTDALAPGWALVATQGHGLRAIGVQPLAIPATGAQE